MGEAKAKALKAGQPVPASEAVTVAYVHSTEVAYSWVHSLIQMFAADLTTTKRVAKGGFIAMACHAGQIAEARNRAAETFLSEDKSDWLLWLDTDMGFLPDIIERLMETANPETAPIVGALCFSQRQISPDDFGGRNTIATPTIFRWVERAGMEGYDIVYDYPPGQVIRCDGTGSAAILIHKSVFQRVHEQHGPTWYDPVRASEGRVGEDLSFCMRATALGFPVLVDTRVKTTHMKPVWLSEADFLDMSSVPPAAEEVAVLVPVVERPEHAEPFMRSLRASTGLAKAYAICDQGDEDAILAWKQAGATVLELPAEVDRPMGSFARKVNHAFGQTTEPWVFLTGSDVEFHPDWLNQAAAMAGGDRFSVVGTNDLGNPRVTAGEHATHMLIRRSYVQEHGASWAGPGVVACEEYRHWYVDDEIVTAAKQRGVWTSALGSKVEHLHPLWGKGARDAVYTLGEQSMDKDKAVFERRLREHSG